MVHGRDRGTQSTHGTRVSSMRNMPLVTTPTAADPDGSAAPAVLRVTATPAQLGLLDTVTIAPTSKIVDAAKRLSPGPALAS